MCGFLIFAWIPEKYIGTALGFVSSSCLVGAFPNTYIGLDEELLHMRWLIGTIGILFIILAIFDVWFLYTHPC